MTEKGIRKAFGKRTATWRGAPKRSTKIGKPRAPKGRVFFVEVPKAAQSSVAIGHLGPARNAKDYFATSIMSGIFGGGFSGRLNMNLREDKGYAYGAGGGFRYNQTGSVMAAGARVQSDKTKESLIELYKEFTALATGEKPVTEVEVSREKRGAILSLPGQFATSRAVLGRYQDLVRYGLPLTYYDNYVENVQSVTNEQIAAAAKAHLKTNDVRVLVVGDAEQSLPGLYQLVADQTFGAGDLVVLDADGKVLETVSPAEAKKRL